MADRSFRVMTFDPGEVQPWPIWHLVLDRPKLAEIFLGVRPDAQRRANEIPGAWVGHVVVTEVTT